MGSAGCIKIACIFWLIKKYCAEIISHRDNYCMRKNCHWVYWSWREAPAGGFKWKRKLKKMKSRKQRVYILMLIMHKKLLLITAFHFSRDDILTMRLGVKLLNWNPTECERFSCLHTLKCCFVKILRLRRRNSRSLSSPCEQEATLPLSTMKRDP